VSDWNADNIKDITKEQYHEMSEDVYSKLDEGTVKALGDLAKDGNWDEFASESSVE